MQSEKKRGNRPGRPPIGKSLNPELVAEAAARLLDAHGIDEFSMRRLGQILGVEAMALYNHFEGKEAILDAVASLTLARIPVPPPKGSWRNRIKAVCLSIRALAHEHANLVRLAITRKSVPTAALPLLESVLAAFADGGLGPEAQATAYHTCFLYVRGFCLWEIEQFSGNGNPESAQIPIIPLELPRTAAARQFIFAPDLDRQFEAGIDIILRGLPNMR